MEYKAQYLKNNPKSIEDYGKKMIGKTFADICNEDNLSQNSFLQEESATYEANHENKKRKGGLGELVEERFFHYQANNEAKPDFEEAGVELKVTPYKINKNKTKSAKERLVLTMIDYFSVVNETFEESHLWQKARLILLVYYLYQKEIENRLDYRIDYVKLFSPTEEDRKIIEQDFNTIVAKIKEGKAHELSEGDTLYLGAAPKAASSADRRQQPFSEELAKPRAFSYKTSYMTYVLNNYIIPGKDTYEPIVKSSEELTNKSFAELIVDKIDFYKGKSDKELCNLFGREYNNNKAQWVDLAYRMLGIKSNRAEEFQKANIVVKAIRIEENGVMRESSPLPTLKFQELVHQEWEESELYDYLLNTKFLFVVYKKSEDVYYLKGAQLWSMPQVDLEGPVKEGWKAIQEVVKNGLVLTPKETKKGTIICNNFPHKSANKIIHVRPHAAKSYYVFSDGTTSGNGSIKDTDELPDGRRIPMQSFWLNNTYILSQVKNEFK